MKYIKKIKEFILRRPGLLFLIVILSVMSFGMIKPGFYLLGWDNFSSYLNLDSNIFTTFFGVWREHRGLGVASDAEVNDIFRQLFGLIIRPIFGLKVIDQLYMVVMLWAGTLGMYAVGRYIAKLIKFETKYFELLGSIAAFLYLFNQSTLSVFYFPMMMYVTRYMMLPTTIYVLLKQLNEIHISKKTHAWYLFLLFVGMGAYMVPTIFVVMMMFFGLMFLFFKKTKRFFLVMCFYLVINMFWILPFANYTIQKGDIVPSAPTFIEINEAMLNKPKEFFSFEKQAKLRPSFYESQFMNNASGELTPFHPMATQDTTGTYRIILWIFPFLYLSGIIYTLAFNRNRILLWLSATASVFLILSMKEYSIFGQLYAFMIEHIPLASTVFRFGDTKFHAMIAFAGSLLGAVVLIQLQLASWKIISSKIKKYVFSIVLTGIVISQLFAFRNYFDGNVIGFFMYNHVPSAYFEMAKMINDDTENIRVIHLPFDKHTYWKPYSWGYFGSSFFHFMINKPLFDRAFEPASTENAKIHARIMELLDQSASVQEKELLEKRGVELLALLKELSIKYIVDDNSISTNINARNITYWGDINPIDSHILIDYLADQGYIELVKKYDIDLNKFTESYSSLYPYNRYPNGTELGPQEIYFYKIPVTAPRVELLKKVDIIHSLHSPILDGDIKTTLDHYVQDPSLDDKSIIYPFGIDQAQYSIDKSSFGLSLPIQLEKGKYMYEQLPYTNSIDQQSHAISVFIEKNDDNYEITLKELSLPSFSQTDARTPIDRTIIIPIDNKYTHVLVDKTTLPIIAEKLNKVYDLGTVLVTDDTFSLSLLYEYDSVDISRNLNQEAADPQCFEQVYPNKTSRITGDNGILTIAGQNVSNCITINVAMNSSENDIAYGQLEFTTKGKRQDISPDKKLDLAKPQLSNAVKEYSNPLTMYACIKGVNSEICSNDEVLFRIPELPNRFVVPFTGILSDIDSYKVTLGVRTNLQESYETETTDILLKRFASSTPVQVKINNTQNPQIYFEIKNKTAFEISTPLLQSRYTQILNLEEDGIMIGRDPSCDGINNDHSIKETMKGILSYNVGCKNIFNKNIPFSSNNQYVWNIDYAHFAGSAPAFIIMDSNDTYYYTKLFSNNVHPNDAFYLPLQNPESIFVRKNTISKVIDETPSYSISGKITPQYDLNDTKNKEIIIDHFTQQEGLVQMQSISLMKIPEQWIVSKFYPSTYEPLTFDGESKNVSIDKIFPFYWKVTLNANGITMLKFNEAYDSQWKLIGAENVNHLKCDGYANCYTFTNAKNTLYLIFWPQLLEFVGFGIMGAVIALLFFSKKR